MFKVIMLSLLILSGCAAIMPIASTGGYIRSEMQLKSLEDQVKENNQIIDFLLDYHKELFNGTNIRRLP
jgi:uncharacterized protein YceK|tara:strand:+ start:10868 stop:11074 length:207 start_codon:yes stop_codon:yes gene_type:complete